MKRFPGVKAKLPVAIVEEGIVIGVVAGVLVEGLVLVLMLPEETFETGVPTADAVVVVVVAVPVTGTT